MAASLEAKSLLPCTEVIERVEFDISSIYRRASEGFLSHPVLPGMASNQPVAYGYSHNLLIKDATNEHIEMNQNLEALISSEPSRYWAPTIFTSSAPQLLLSFPHVGRQSDAFHGFENLPTELQTRIVRVALPKDSKTDREVRLFCDQDNSARYLLRGFNLMCPHAETTSLIGVISSTPNHGLTRQQRRKRAFGRIGTCPSSET
ncbi:hypothetical protein EJ02DRAFT_515775 [Clathrospora elynae]|uniref:Uncharacterized protein n=1 Tax=Clathrospora elynae TaxID=706981 RepID=A0A6A5SGH9_9PLEO|nr:hypothetical protein EJ02DRAFT_515775 [Clathrospora elynae]